VVIHDLDVVRVVFTPDETDAELVVYPNAVLTLPVALEPFQTIARGTSQVEQADGGVQHPELPLSDSLQVGR